MKQIFSTFILVLLQHFLFSQTGTIKIAKPVKKDTVITPERLRFIIHAGSNYTFKSNRKIDYAIGISSSQISFNNPNPSHFSSMGIEYCVEEQYFEISAYNKAKQMAETPYSKSQNHSEYLKVPLQLGITMILAGVNSKNRGSLQFILGLKPEYLLKTKDENNRLVYSDFKQFNLAGSFTIGIPIKKHYRIDLGYSKDFFENLKDRNLYDPNGAITGKQKTKTNLLSISLNYGF